MPADSTLNTLVEELADAIRAVEGLKNCPPYPGDKAGVWPAIAIFPNTGDSFWNTQGEFRTLHNIIIQFHYPLQDLSQAIEESLKYAVSIPNAIFSAFLDLDLTNVDTGGGESGLLITYRFAGGTWADVDTTGFEFEVREIKIRTTIT